MLEELLEKWRRGARGPLPHLTSLQLLNALVLIEQEGPIGRRALSRALMINDGIARGMLERLGEQKIVSVSGTGVRLSPDGLTILKRLLDQMSIRKILALDETGLVPGKKAVAVHVSGKHRPDITGIPQRDEAIKAGAEGSIIIVVKQGKLVIPPDNRDTRDIVPKDNSRFRDLFQPGETDLIVIGFAKDSRRALFGALAAVVSLAAR